MGIMYYEGDTSPRTISRLPSGIRNQPSKNPESMAYLGEMDLHGISISPDQEKGLALFQESMQMECFIAWITLALSHLDGWMPSP